MNKQDTERLKKNKKDILFALDDCTGCTDPRSEGTHQMWSKQHFFEWYIEPYYTPQTTEGEEIKREAVEGYLLHLTRTVNEGNGIQVFDRLYRWSYEQLVRKKEEYLTQQSLDKGGLE